MIVEIKCKLTPTLKPILPHSGRSYFFVKVVHGFHNRYFSFNCYFTVQPTIKGKTTDTTLIKD